MNVRMSKKIRRVFSGLMAIALIALTATTGYAQEAVGREQVEIQVMQHR